MHTINLLTSISRLTRDTVLRILTNKVISNDTVGSVCGNKDAVTILVARPSTTWEGTAPIVVTNDVTVSNTVVNDSS